MAKSYHYLVDSFFLYNMGDKNSRDTNYKTSAPTQENQFHKLNKYCDWACCVDDLMDHNILHSQSYFSFLSLGWPFLSQLDLDDLAYVLSYPILSLSDVV